MPMTLEPVRPIALAEIRAARKRIAGTIVRTPLVRLELGPGFPDIRLKLENLQPINAYKLRGAANAVARLSEAERQRGVWTISAGNAGQGVAYAARKAGVPCTVVVIETAPASKIERMRALGAKLILVPYAVAWQALEEHSFPGMEGTLVHPFDDHHFIPGHATMGLEILEDAPDTAAVIAAIGGGGLITGVGSAVKALKPALQVWSAEPETAAPAALSFAMGSPQMFKDWKPSFVDGAGGQSVFPRMWQRMKPLVDGCIVVSLEETKRAMRLMAEKARVIAEGAGALPLAAALTGKAGPGPDRGDRLRRQHRSEEVLRADRLGRGLKSMKTLPRLVFGLLLTACLGFARAELADAPFVLGPRKFREGDDILLQQVRATSPKLEIGSQIVVRGRYDLQSKEKATLALFLTQTAGDGKESISPTQTMEVKQGTGEFELSYAVKHAGVLHVTFHGFPDGKPWGECISAPSRR